MSTEDSPSDYDSSDLLSQEKSVTVDTEEGDNAIRDALKRELLLLASITNRGEFTSAEEKNIVIDLVTQLEALNPTADPASNCEGEWDLCLASTSAFRTSPFFLSIRAALGDSNKAIAENGFDIHSRATTASRIGRVRQVVESGTFVNEVDLEVGMVPGLPIVVKGTVITTANLDIRSADLWTLKIKGTKVKKSNIPFLNQYLDDLPWELPWGDLYSSVTGSTPEINLKTFYVDEGLRITRDVDDNFFIFTRP